MTRRDPHADLLQLPPVELLVTPDNIHLVAYLAGKDVAQVAQRLVAAAETGVVCTVTTKKTEDEVKYLKARYKQAKADIERARQLIDGPVVPPMLIDEDILG